MEEKGDIRPPLIKRGEINFDRMNKHDLAKARDILKLMVREVRGTKFKGELPLSKTETQIEAEISRLKVFTNLDSFFSFTEKVCEVKLSAAEKFLFAFDNLGKRARALGINGVRGVYPVVLLNKKEEERLLHELNHIALMIAHGEKTRVGWFPVAKWGTASIITSLAGLTAMETGLLAREDARIIMAAGAGIWALGLVSYYAGYHRQEAEQLSREASRRVEE